MISDRLEIYADQATIMVSPTISKIDFYSVVDSSDGNVEDELKVKITIPTLSLLKLCARFVNLLKVDEQQIMGTLDSHKEQIVKILENINIEDIEEE